MSINALGNWLPIERIAETHTVLAFHHPQPAYAVHILIVPKKTIHDLLSFTDDTMIYARDALLMAQRLIRQLSLDEAGYRLIVNGGEYQDVKQVHFHLISGPPLD